MDGSAAAVVAPAAEVTYDLDLWCEGCNERVSDQDEEQMIAHQVNADQAAALGDKVQPGCYHDLCCPLPECS